MVFILRKYKLFLDDTIPGCLDTPEKLEIMTDTQYLWRNLHVYDVVLLETTAKTYESQLKHVKYEIISIKKDIVDLAGLFAELPFINSKDMEVCTKLSAAHICECDFFVSWDYENIVNTTTMRGIKIMAMLENLKDIIICSPTILIK